MAALLLTTSAGAGALIATLPTLATQIAVLLGAGLSTVTVLAARAGTILNPAWIIIAWLYLIGPIGRILLDVGVGLSPVALLTLAPIPFVVTALLARPVTRERLLLLTPLALLLGLGGLTLLWTSEPAYGSEKLVLWMLTGLLPAAFIVVLAPATRTVSWSLIAGVALLSAIGLILFGNDTPLNPGRRILFDANPIWVGRAAFIGALVMMFGPFPRLAKLSATPILIVAGLLTISLGPAVGLLVGAWTGAAEKLRIADRTDRRLVIGWAMLGLVGGLAVAAVLIGVFDPGSSALARLVVDDPNVTSRARLLGAAGSLFLQAPVLGTGLGGFAATGLDLYPHNLIAEIAVELGLVGILVSVLWLALSLRGAARSPLLMSLMVATGAFALFSGSLAGNNEFWMISALAIARFPLGINSRAQGPVVGNG